MTDDTPPAEPDPYRKAALRTSGAPKGVPRPSSAQLMARIRFLATETAHVIFGDHAQDRMEERGIFDADVFEVLRIGEPRGAVLPGEDPGEWKVKVVAKPRGSRQVGVVTIVMMNGYLFIKTVEWEDR